MTWTDGGRGKLLEKGQKILTCNDYLGNILPLCDLKQFIRGVFYVLCGKKLESI